MSQTATRADRLKAAHDKLQSAVAEIVSVDDWKRMLKVASKFHRYSFNNHLMIFLQRPRCHGRRRLQPLEVAWSFRQEGEKGIAIFAPCKYRAKVETHDGQETTLQQIRGFRVVHVFEISQTEGDELPDLDAWRPKLLDADAPEGIWDALVAPAQEVGYEVIRQKRESENGYCDVVNKQIAVRPDVSPAQAVKTLVHELGHALLHGDESPKSKEIAEVEVEFVAYIVCDAIGLDSGDYSFAFVARWSEGLSELVKDTAERVIECAKQSLQLVEVRREASSERVA